MEKVKKTRTLVKSYFVDVVCIWNYRQMKWIAETLFLFSDFNICSMLIICNFWTNKLNPPAFHNPLRGRTAHSGVARHLHTVGVWIKCLDQMLLNTSNTCMMQ